MPNLRPVPISDNPHSSWQNLIQKTVQSQNLVAGSGLKVSSAMGEYTKISLPPDVDFEHLVWRGDFDEFAEYQVNDVVRLSANKKYIDIVTGIDLEIGSTSETGYTSIPISIGLFVCVNHVPPAWANEYYFENDVLTTFPDTIPYSWQDGIRWDTYNIYYPIYPEIPSQYTSSVDSGYGFTIKANQTFWNAMPFGCMPMKVCQDGIAKTFYVIGEQSGSVYLPEYIPYESQ